MDFEQMSFEFAFEKWSTRWRFLADDSTRKSTKVTYQQPIYVDNDNKNTAAILYQLMHCVEYTKNWIAGADI